MPYQLSKIAPDQSLNYEQLIAEMNSEISSIQAILRLTPETCFILLQKFKWDNKSLLKAYHSMSSKKEFLVENGLVSRDTEVNIINECSVCFFENELSSLSCQHLACQECWKSYLKDKVDQGENMIECIGPNCKIIVDDEKIETFLSGQVSLQNYRKLNLNSYVEAKAELYWCLNPECEKAIRQSHVKPIVVCSSCGNKFCTLCENPSHFPASCRQLQLWKTKCAALMPTNGNSSLDKKSYEWILAHTKNCPKCLTPIQKNGGCIKMTCSNKKCRCEFCWVCLSKWTIHSYSCNRAVTMNNGTKARNDFRRFILHFDKLEEYKDSLELEEKSRSQFKDKLNPKHMKDAQDMILDAREALMYSVVFGYYFDNEQFEEKQKKLEKDVNNLSKCLKECLQMEENSILITFLKHKTALLEKSFNRFLKDCTAESVVVDQKAEKAPKMKKIKDKFICCPTILHYLYVCLILFLLTFFGVMFYYGPPECMPPQKCTGRNN